MGLYTALEGQLPTYQVKVAGSLYIYIHIYIYMLPILNRTQEPTIWVTGLLRQVSSPSSSCGNCMATPETRPAKSEGSVAQG